MRMQSPKTPQPVPRPVRWVASSKDDLSAFPNDVKTRVGGALWDAQIGLKSPAAKPLKGFGDAGVLEVVVDFDGNTFRTVYTGRSPRPSTSFTRSKRSLGVRLLRRRATWTSSERGSLAPKRIMKHG
jgi:hypothetical protein